MCIFLQTLIVLVSLLAQCGAHTDQRKHRTTQLANQSAQKPGARECDFSVYKPVREDHFIQRAIKERVKPTYPPEAVSGRIQGLVSVKILINRNGDVEKACALDRDDVLRRVAEAAALQWKFKPRFGAASATDAGLRRYMVDVIAFHFVLDEANKAVSQNVVTVQP